MRRLLIVILLTLVYQSVSGQIIITEIFADPKPSRGLPETEFLEIYNTGQSDINLSGYQLTYGKTVAQFPDSTIKSNQYAILVRATFYEDYLSYGNVIALPRLSLNNNGATLRIVNPQGEEIHFVSYSTDWYIPGKNKGYSLEMIDIEYPCAGKTNWASSKSEQGASPGRENTLSASNPDIALPQLLHYNIENESISLVFDKNMSESLVNDPGHFELLNSSATIEEVKFEEYNKNIIIVKLDRKPEDRMVLNIYNPTDCSGNIGSDRQITILDLPEPLPGEIQISEVLFNPLTGGQDFVELHNPTDKVFNLKNWMFGNINNRGESGNYKTIASYDLYIEANNYVAFTTDQSFLTDNYPKTGNIIEVSALPAYNNDKGTVLLLKPDSTLFDSFSYTEKMHAELINNPKGVSLEKTSFNSSNVQWMSASADVGFATPGLKNSQLEDKDLDQFFKAEPVVFNPYQNSIASYTELVYKLNSSGNYGSITILDRSGRKVKHIGSNILLGASGKIKWDGTDDSGQVLPVGYYLFNITVYNKDYNKKFFTKTVIGSY